MVLLGACASKDPVPTKVEDRTPVAGSGTTGAPTTSGTQTTPVTGTAGRLDPLKDPNNVLSKRVVTSPKLLEMMDPAKPSCSELLRFFWSDWGSTRLRISHRLPILCPMLRL